VADVNANIGVNIDASNALAQLKSLQRQLSQFHTSVAKSSAAAASAQAGFQKNLINSINATGAFSAELRTVRTTSEAFTNSLEKNKFSMREYFRYAGAATKTFGKNFKSEFDTIGKVAEDRVKKLQTQYIKLGRDTSGAMKAIAIIPNQLDLSNHSTQVQIAAQKQAIFNQLLKQGSTNLLNFGKNTQWAGRQLMVGFTLPLASLGMVASKSFMDMEAAALKFRKVYGDLLTPKEETQKALDNVQKLAQEFTKYGIAVSTTVSLAAEAAAAGFQGLDLQRQTTEATRLSILGQIDTQQALGTTIALQNAFKMSSEDLADSINFLNAVENQTVVSLDDITTAIPKVAPVIQQLGGDVKDLAFFMTAMKQGGINASEGANALKSGLASLINPTNTASKMLAGMGINIKNIVESNQGDLKSTVIDFALALDKLDPLNRARAIEQMFGKFQFARLSALFSNVIADGTQASRVLDLAGASIEELSALSESELGMTAESSMNKFKKAVEDLKFALVPVGKTFLEAVTPIVEFFGNIIEKFSALSDNTKKIITILTITIGGIGPVALMAFGLLANGIANIIKLFGTLRNGYLRLTGQSAVLGEQTNYMTNEQLEAAAAAHSLNQTHANLTQTFTAESSAVRALISAYMDATAAASRFAMANPGMMLPGRGGAPKKLAVGGILSGPGTGTSDSIPAMLSNGEAVIPAKNVRKYPTLVAGLIAGNIPGFSQGVLNVGGGVTRSLDINKSTNLPGMQRMLDAVLDSTNGVANTSEILEEVFERLAGSSKVSIGKFVAELDMATKKITGEGLSPDVFKAAGRDRLYKGKVSTKTQIKGNELLTEEYERAQASARAAQEAGREYARQQGIVLEENDARIVQAGEVQRAHIVEMQNQTDKLFNEAWEPDMWVAQAAPLNQLSNIIGDNERGQRNNVVMLERLAELKSEGFINESQALEMQRKINAGLALTDQELIVQKEMLTRILRSRSDLDRMTPAFPMQAAMVVGGTEYLEANPAREGVGTRQIERTQAQQAVLAAAVYEHNPGQNRNEYDLRTPGARAAATARVEQDARDDARARNRVIESETQDIYVASRDRRSPHAQVPKDAKDDAIAYDKAREQQLTQSGRKRRMSSRPEGAAPIGPAAPAGTAFLPIVSQLTKEEAKKDKRDKQKQAALNKAKSVGSKFSGTGAGIGLSSAAMLASSFLPAKIGDLIQKVGMVGFAFSALKPVIMALVGVIGVGPLALVAVAGLAAFGIFKLNKASEQAAKDIQESAKREAEARYGSSRAIDQFGKTFNKALPSEREFSRNNKQSIAASGKTVSEFAKDYASDNNISTQIINQAALKGRDSGVAAAAMDVASKAAIFGLSPDEIAANIKAASDLIGADQVKVKLAVQELLAPDGEDILKKPLNIKSRIDFLDKNNKKQIESIKKSIVDVSNLGSVSKPESIGMTLVKGGFGGALAGGLAAGVPGAIAGTAMGMIGQIPAILNASKANEQYKASQETIQSASVQLSIAFMQQKESLALLNAQFSDGKISQAEYDAQMLVSMGNFTNLEKSSQTLVTALMKIDGTGELASAAVKDLGDQALGTLKKSNPALFDKITKSFEGLSNSAKINIFMGYAQGSLTIMDLAIIPKLLKEIEGKGYQATIKIIMDSELSGGAKGTLTVPQAEAELKAAEAALKKSAGLDVAKIQRVDEARRLLADAKKLEADAIKVNQTGNLNTDGGGATGGVVTSGKALTAAEKYLKVLEAEISALEKKRDANKAANNEMQRQIDLQLKMQDLSNQMKIAQISGNYLGASLLGQQQRKTTLEFNQETKEIEAQKVIDRMKEREAAIKDGAKLTPAERAKLNKNKVSANVPKFHNWNGPVPGTYGQELPAMLRSGTEGVYQEGYINNLKQAASGTTNSGSTVYNIDMTVNGAGSDPKQVAELVMKKMEVVMNKNNKTNAGLR
jgi:TP901 family phage tail tape measure protein